MLHRITALDAPELEPYRNLRQRNPTRHARRFIAEGDKLVERLLASRYQAESIFAAEDYVERLLPCVPPDVPVYVAPRRLLEETIGFNFHRGCLACGVRPLERGLKDWPPPSKAEWTIVVCPEIHDPTNLGALLRNCAAFGVDLVLLGTGCADPFSRRVLRVSMGAVLDLQLVTSAALGSDLDDLRREHGLRTIATVLDPAAESLASFRDRPPRLAILLGGEAHGLDDHWVATADRRVTIPMLLGTDSLNLAVASGIFLYAFTSLPQRSSHPPGADTSGVKRPHR